MSPNNVTDYITEDDTEGVVIPGSDGELEAVPTVNSERRSVHRTFAAARAIRGSKNPVLRINRSGETDASNHAQYLKRKADEYLTEDERKAKDRWHISSSGDKVFVVLLGKNEPVPY